MRNPRLDPQRDDAILAAAAALLLELGYDAMSIEAIAARAGVGKATIYRRYRNKAELILDTVRGRGLQPDEPPDTGTLRGDLLALYGRLQSGLGEQGVGYVNGVLSAMRADPELTTIARDQLITAWAASSAAIVEQAIARGELPPGEVSELLGVVGPSVVLTRVLIDMGPVDDAFCEQLVDELLIPILRGSRP